MKISVIFLTRRDDVKNEKRCPVQSPVLQGIVRTTARRKMFSRSGDGWSLVCTDRQT